MTLRLATIHSLQTDGHTKTRAIDAYGIAVARQKFMIQLLAFESELGPYTLKWTEVVKL